MSALQLAGQGLTAAIAIYGAALSTYNAVHAHQKDRCSIKIRMTTAMLTWGADLGPPMVSIEVINDGHR